MKIVKNHPVVCKHQWSHGRYPINSPKNPIQNVLVWGYFCDRCKTIWKTSTDNGIIKPVGEEPRIQIGICEIDIPTTTKESPHDSQS